MGRRMVISLDDGHSLVVRRGVCTGCGRPLRAGERIVVRHDATKPQGPKNPDGSRAPNVVLCPRCGVH